MHYCDPRSGLRAIIAIHHSRLGPALGGCRMFPYASDGDALTDVLRLSRGMTYKAALAGLPQGGGKSVILGDPSTEKTPEKMRALGRCVDQLGGRYIIAEDSGTTVEDMLLVSGVTQHVGGLADASARASGRSGDPSPATAYGTFVGIVAAVRHALRRDSLEGVRVAVQGLGNVGYRLCQLLHAAGAQLWVADTAPGRVARCVQALGATAVAVDDIHAQKVDVLAPCALGGVIHPGTLPRLRARIVAGAANNQLATPVMDAALRERGVLYAPDYVINAGGIIEIHHERIGYHEPAVRSHLERIGVTLTEIFRIADATDRPTAAVADAQAEAIFRAP